MWVLLSLEPKKPKEQTSNEKLNKVLLDTNKGNSNSQFLAGLYYYEGINVLQNYEEAINWFLKSAENGNLNACRYLGICYYNGTGVKKNISKSLHCFVHAAKYGDIESQICMGKIYILGNGIKINYIEAYKWFNLAGINNDDIRPLRDEIASKLTSEELYEVQNYQYNLIG